MSDLYARPVFFVADCEAARAFYRDRLGFTPEWDAEEEGRITVCQVGFRGFDLILCEVWAPTLERRGKGRVFIGLEDEQGPSVIAHLVEHRVEAERVSWGRPTLRVADPDGNEIFFWLPGDEFGALGL